MFDIRKIYGTDESKEEGGTEIQIGDNVFITVARDGNKKYNALLAKLYTAQKFVLDQKNEQSEEVARNLTVEAMANHILVGWRGDIGLDGQATDYSVENAKALLAVKDFRDLVTKQSRDFANYKLTVDEATAKN